MIAGCLVIIIITGLVGLGLAVIAILGWIAWQHVGLIALVFVMASSCTILIRATLNKFRKQRDIGS